MIIYLLSAIIVFFIFKTLLNYIDKNDLGGGPDQFGDWG